MAAVSGFGEEQADAEVDGPGVRPAPTPLLSSASAPDDGSFEQAPAVAQAAAEAHILPAPAITEEPAAEAPAVIRAPGGVPREFAGPQLDSPSLPPVAAQLHFAPEPQPTGPPPVTALVVAPEPPPASAPPSVQLHIAQPELEPAPGPPPPPPAQLHLAPPQPTPPPPVELHLDPEPEPTLAPAPAPPVELHLAPAPHPEPAPPPPPPPPAVVAAAPGPVGSPPPARSPVPAAPTRPLIDPLAPLAQLEVPHWLAVAGPSAFVKSAPETRPTPSAIAGSEDLDRAFDQKAPKERLPQGPAEVEPAIPSADRVPEARRAPTGVWSSSAAAAPRLAPRPAPNDGLPQTTRGRQGRPDAPWSGRPDARPATAPPAAAGEAPAADTIALPGRPRRPPPRHRGRGRSLASSSTHGGRATRAGRRRLSDPISTWRRLASVVELLLTTVVLGVLLAAVLAGAIGAIVVALQHALNG